MKTPMKSWGISYIVVAVLAGHSSLVAMMASVNGALQSWWMPAAFAAAILLFTDGISQCFRRISSIWLVVIAATPPIAICALFGEWPLRCWVVSVTMAILEAAFLKIDSLTGRKGIASFASSAVLVAALGNSTVGLFLYYWNSKNSLWTLGDILGFMLPFVIPWFVLVTVLVHTGLAVFRYPTMKSGDVDSTENMQGM